MKLSQVWRDVRSIHVSVDQAAELIEQLYCVGAIIMLLVIQLTPTYTHVYL